MILPQTATRVTRHLADVAPNRNENNFGTYTLDPEQVSSWPSGGQAECYDLSSAESHSLRLSTSTSRDGLDPRDATYYRNKVLGRGPELLPPGLGLFLRTFVGDEQAAACVIRGLPIDAEVGTTPTDWREIEHDRPTISAERYLAACGIALGEPFTWQTLQSGRMIQDIVPIRGEEAAQSGHGSKTLLKFHTEDGFHPKRCDYLLLLGIRNPDHVPTFVSSIKDVKLDQSYRDVLFEPRYHILPDDEHIKQLATDNPCHPDLQEALTMRDNPAAVSVLFGARHDPYLRIDYPFMRTVRRDGVAQEALEALMHELYRVKRDVSVEPGSLLIVDNYRAVHGRAPFKARYDGNDRWLKRMVVHRTRPRLGGATTEPLAQVG